MSRAWTKFRSPVDRRWAVDRAMIPFRAGRRREPAGARVLLVNQYYWPVHLATPQHLTDLAESLAERGFEVHVLCGKGGATSALKSHEVRNGVTIHRVGATDFGRKSTIGRMADYLSFYASATLKALRLPRFDAVVTLTTPPLIALIGSVLKRLKGSRHVYWSMDLHPDASIALGQMSARNPLVALLLRLGDAAYRNADRVVSLGAYMADRLSAKGVKPSRLEIIPVWSRREEIAPLPREGHPLRRSLGLDGKFVAMYSGNLGKAHTATEMIEAARRLRHRDDIVFAFVGGGPRTVEVRSAVEECGLTNVRFLDYFPREQLKQSLSVADVHFTTMRREATGIVVPSKLYGAMAAGRPTIFVGPAHCEAADAVRDAGCGYSLALGDVDGLVDAIEALADDPEAADAMGRKARQAFLLGYERGICVERWSSLLAELVGSPAAVPALVKVAG